MGKQWGGGNEGREGRAGELRPLGAGPLPLALGLLS